MSVANLSRLLLLALTLLLASCGGGGSASSDSVPIQVTVNPRSVTASYLANDPNSSGPEVTVAVDVSPLPEGTVYPVIIEDQPVLSPGKQFVTRNGGGSFTAHIVPRSDLALGTHRGTLTLRLCKDSACTSEYTLSGTTSLTYEFNVSAALAVSMTVGGVPAVDANLQQFGTSGHSLTISVPDMSDAVLTSNIPVNWSVVQFSGPTVSLTANGSTPTTWQANLSGVGGSLTITASPLDTAQAPASFDVHIR